MGQKATLSRTAFGRHTHAHLRHVLQHHAARAAAVLTLHCGADAPASAAVGASEAAAHLSAVYAALLALNIVELAALLFLTGGLQNPFSFLFLGPVLISATALPRRMTLLLGGLNRDRRQHLHRLMARAVEEEARRQRKPAPPDSPENPPGDE